MMMNQVFSFRNIRVTLAGTSDEVLMNAARYQVRLLQSRADATAPKAPIMENITRFSLILAHVTHTTGFPFAIPDPLAHPETVGLAWDAYMSDGPELWDQLALAIEPSSADAKQIADKLPAATEELHTLSAHHISPFKRKQREKR
jgi:hypothetical protein